jgi:hypothetical protein
MTTRGWASALSVVGGSPAGMCCCFQPMISPPAAGNVPSGQPNARALESLAPARDPMIEPQRQERVAPDVGRDALTEEWGQALSEEDLAVDDATRIVSMRSYIAVRHMGSVRALDLRSGYRASERLL